MGLSLAGAWTLTYQNLEKYTQSYFSNKKMIFSKLSINLLL